VVTNINKNGSIAAVCKVNKLEQVTTGHKRRLKTLSEHGKRKNMYGRFRNHCMYENHGDKCFPFPDTIYCKSLGIDVHLWDTLGVGVQQNVCGSQFS